MTQTIPRPLVAAALGVVEDQLPPGDLPMARFAQRFLMFLRDTEEDEDFTAHPEVWTATLATTLAQNHPELALGTLRVALAEAATQDDIELIAAGPMTELFLVHGADMLTQIETLATQAPRFAAALGGLYPEGAGSPLLWARLRSLSRPLPEDDSLPEATGLMP